MADDDDRTGPDDGRFVFGDEGPGETSDTSLGAETVVAIIVVVSVLGAALFVIGFPFLGGLTDGGTGAEGEPAGPTTGTAGGATEQPTTAGTRTTIGSATTDLGTVRTTATAPPNATSGDATAGNTTTGNATPTATPTSEPAAESGAPSAPESPAAAASGTPTDTPAGDETATPTEVDESGEADASGEADGSGEAETPTDAAASGDADTPTDADGSDAGDGDESPIATPASRSPVVESFDVTDASNGTVAVFDVAWTVADPDDDLSGVTVGLVADPDGEAPTVAEQSFEAGGSDSAGETRFTVPDGAGSTYELRIEATDADGNTVFELTRAVADGEPDG